MKSFIREVAVSVIVSVVAGVLVSAVLVWPWVILVWVMVR